MQSRKFTISFLKHIGITSCDVKDITFDELLLEFRRTSKREFKGKINKENFALGLEGIICGNLTGGKRAADNLTCRSIITYDIDNYNDNLDILEKYLRNSLSKHTYIYYTTTSSTFDKPKMRVLLFLNEVIPPQNYAKLSKDIAIQLIPEIALDEASYVAMQVMYMPCRIDGFRSGKNVGELIDTSNYQVVVELEPEGKIKKTRVKKVKETTCDEVSTARDELSQSEGEGTNCPPPLDEIEEQEDIDDFMEASQDVLNIVSDEKVDETLTNYNVESTGYYEWFRVCQGLHHNYNGGEEGLKKFITWSLQDSRYDKDQIPNKCAEKYRSLKLNKNNPITFASTIQLVNNNRKMPIKVSGEEIPHEMPMSEFIHFKRNKDGDIVKPKSTFENFKILCEYYGVDISYDIITKRNVNSLNIADGNILSSRLKSLMILNNMEKGEVVEFIYRMAKEKDINSFKEIMNNVIWDGKSRLKEFYSTINVNPEHESLKEAYLDCWVKQMLYLGLYEGNRKVARYILVLKGEQEIGKSTWIKSLLPSHISPLYIGAGQLNTEIDMKILACIKYLILELSELGRSFKKTDINAFKAFIGATSDELNIKFVDYPVTFLRTTSFVGTINDDVFLKDETGSTRFLVLPVINCNGYHDVDMLQLLKEYLETTDWVNFELSKENREKQKVLNENFEQPSMIEEEFVKTYDIDANNGNIWQTCQDILKQFGHSNITIKQKDRLEIGRILKKYGFEQRHWDKAYKVKLRNNKNSL